jgi:hypothetical protein
MMIIYHPVVADRFGFTLPLEDEVSIGAATVTEIHLVGVAAPRGNRDD